METLELLIIKYLVQQGHTDLKIMLNLPYFGKKIYYDILFSLTFKEWKHSFLGDTIESADNLKFISNFLGSIEQSQNCNDSCPNSFLYSARQRNRQGKKKTLINVKSI